MALTPANGLGIFKRGEPLAVGDPKTGNTGGFDWFNRGEPIAVVTTAAVTASPARRTLLGVGA